MQEVTCYTDLARATLTRTQEPNVGEENHTACSPLTVLQLAIQSLVSKVPEHNSIVAWAALFTSTHAVSRIAWTSLLLTESFDS